MTVEVNEQGVIAAGEPELYRLYFTPTTVEAIHARRTWVPPGYEYSSHKWLVACIRRPDDEFRASISPQDARDLALRLFEWAEWAEAPPVVRDADRGPEQEQEAT